MQVMFNSQERTLREMVTLTLSAGWKIIRVTKTSGSLFGHMVAVPVAIPHPQPEKTINMLSFEGQAGTELIEIKNQEKQSEYDAPRVAHKEKKRRGDMEIVERASSRCGTPTFGSNTRLSSMQEALARFAGGLAKPKGMFRAKSTPFGAAKPPPSLPLKPAVSLTKVVRKRPSPLSVTPLHGTPSPSQSPRWLVSTSPRHEPSHPHSSSPASPHVSPKTITRRVSLANLLQPHSGNVVPPPLPNATTQQHQPPSPVSPRSITHPPISRRASHAQLSRAQSQYSLNSGIASPSLIPVRTSALFEPPVPSNNVGQMRSTASLGFSSTGIPSQLPPKPTARSRHASNAPLPISQASSRKRSGTVVGPYTPSSRIGVAERSAPSASGPLRKVDSEQMTHSRQSSTTSQSSLGKGGISVLDVAARIERGEFAQRTPSP